MARTFQHSWESAPGKSGVDLGPLEPTAYHALVRNVLIDKAGQDKLVKSFGLQPGTAFDGAGVFGEDISPGTQSESLMRMTGPLSRKQQAILEAIEAVRAYGLGQTAYAGHAVSGEGGDIISVKTGQPLSTGDAKSVVKALKHIGDVAVVPTKEGYNILNLGAEDFAPRVTEALKGQDMSQGSMASIYGELPWEDGIQAVEKEVASKLEKAGLTKHAGSQEVRNFASSMADIYEGLQRHGGKENADLTSSLRKFAAEGPESLGKPKGAIDRYGLADMLLSGGHQEGPVSDALGLQNVGELTGRDRKVLNGATKDALSNLRNYGPAVGMALLAAMSKKGEDKTPWTTSVLQGLGDMMWAVNNPYDALKAAVSGKDETQDEHTVNRVAKEYGMRYLDALMGMNGPLGGIIRKAPIEASRAAEALEARGHSADDIWKLIGVERIPASKMWGEEVSDFAAKASVDAIPKEPGQAAALSSVLDHPKLYEKEPWLRDLPVMYSDKLKGTAQAAYDKRGRLIIINPNRQEGTVPNDDFKSLLLHETQHAVQHRTGMPGGTSSSGMPSWTSDVSTWKGLRAGIEKKIEAAASPEEVKYYQDVGDNIDWLYQQGIQSDPYEMYLRTPGEVQARAVGRRANLNPEVAKRARPRESYDYFEDELPPHELKFHPYSKDRPNDPWGSEAPKGGKSVYGLHFSKAKRDEISTEHYGTGMKGAEAKRLEGADPLIRNRAAFYLNTGNGIQPESGVGYVGHKVRLDNFYDADLDHAKLWDPRNLNESELRIVKAGYGGYFTRHFGRQGAAVALGPQKLRPESVDYGVQDLPIVGE